MRIADANVLLYAVNSASTHHQPAKSWLDAALKGQETVGFSWIALLAFLRLATHPGVFPRSLEPSEAISTMKAWLEQPSAVLVEPTPQHLSVLAGLLAEAGTAGNLVNDAHLAALALEHDATVVSFDADFARFPKVRREVP